MGSRYCKQPFSATPATSDSRVFLEHIFQRPLVPPALSVLQGSTKEFSITKRKAANPQVFQWPELEKLAALHPEAGIHFQGLKFILFSSADAEMVQQLLPSIIVPRTLRMGRPQR